MGIREAINRNQGLFIGLAVAVIAIGVYFSIRNASNTGTGGSLTQVYYTIDDGKTYFADDVNKTAPFMHQGKEAVQAYVFRCGGETTVQYMSRYTEAGRKRRAALAGSPATAGDAAPSAGGESAAAFVEYKRPGETAWVTVQPQPKCPKGEYPEMINP